MYYDLLINILKNYSYIYEKILYYLYILINDLHTINDRIFIEFYNSIIFYF